MLFCINTLILVVCTWAQQAGNSIILTQTNDNKYALQAVVANLNIEIMAHLTNDADWIKMEGCKVCDQDMNCKQSCFTDSEYGVKCSQAYCQRIQDDENIYSGQKVDLKINLEREKKKIIIPTVLADKLKKNYQEIGRINLLNQNSLFGQRILLVKDHSKDIKLFYDGQKGSQQDLFKNIEYVGEVLRLDGENDNDDSGSDNEDDNLYEASQIKVRDLSDPGTVAAASAPQSNFNMKQIDVALTKTQAQFSINTNKLLLPSIPHKKLLSYLLDEYLKEQNCSIQKDRIKCQNSLNIDKLDNVTITLILNGMEIQFPFRVLVTSCEKKSCQILIGVSKQKKTIIIGDFILNVFALQHNSHQKSISLLRLDNQWSKNFKLERQYAKHQINFLWALILIIVKALFWMVKIIFYLAIFSLIVNCGYHWKDILRWVSDIKKKLQARKQRKQMAKNNAQSTGLVQNHEMDDKIGSDSDENQ